MKEQERLDRARQALENLANKQAPDPLQEASARRRFLEQASRLRAGAGVVRKTNRRWHTILLRGGVATCVIMLTFGILTGFASAADRALPGDLLYTIDLSLEKLELSLARRPKTKVGLLLASADERLQEVEQLNSPGTEQQMEIALEAYEQTLADLDQVVDSTVEADHLSLVEMRDQALSVQEQRLLIIRQKAPEQAQPGLDRAIEASQKGPDQGHENNVPEKTPGPPEDRPNDSPPGQLDKTPGPPDDKGNDSSHKTKIPAIP